jgi:hypothetical protein
LWRRASLPARACARADAGWLLIGSPGVADPPHVYDRSRSSTGPIAIALRCAIRSRGLPNGMVSLNKHTRDQVSRSIGSKEPVCLLGPPRSGLSELARGLVKGQGDTRSTSARSLTRVADLWRAFLPTGTPPDDPEAPFDPKVVARDRGLVLITDIHLLDDSTLREVLRVCAEINSVRGGPDSILAVVLEGAVNWARITKLTQAANIPSIPRRIAADPPNNSEVAALVHDELWNRGIHSGWAEKTAIADLCGSDTGFVFDFVDTLQRGQPLTQAAINDVASEVVRYGRTSGAIREHISQLDELGFEILLRLACGQVLVGSEPTSLGDSVLAQLYYRGLASYFVDLRAYAIRSVLTARTVFNSTRATGRPEVAACSSDDTDIAPHSISQLHGAVGWTACLEAALRAYLRFLESRPETKVVIEGLLTSPRSVDDEVQATNRMVSAAIRKNLAEPGPHQPADMAALERLVAKSVSEAIPLKLPLTKIAAHRGCSNEKDTVAYLTLAETISVLDECLKRVPSAGQNRQRLVSALDEFRSIRNIVAHLRPLILETAAQLTTLSSKAYQLLNTIEGIAAS